MAPNYRVLLEKANAENEILRKLVQNQEELIKSNEKMVQKSEEIMNHYNERIKLTDSFVEKQKEIILVLETLVEKQNKKIEELGGQPDDFSPVYEQLQAIVEMKD